MSEGSYETLRWTTADRIVTIALDRPAKRNAFNLQMLRDLSAAYTAFEADDDLWCALVVAEGEHFTAGLDLAEVGPAVAKGGRLFLDGQVDPLDLFAPRRSKPIVMAVQGICFTIGIELLLAADVRLAATDTRFKQMEVQRGIMPFGGGTLRLPQVAGWGNAMQILLSGDEFGAADFYRMGIVQEVATPADLHARARHWAERIAAQAPLAVRAARRSAQLAVEQGRETALAEMMDQARALMTSEDAAEGVQSFVERRKARFRGR